MARTLLERYPLPTSAGTANNYRRVGNETVDQDQFSVRIDQQLRANRDRLFGRLTRFREEFIPVIAAAGGQRCDDRNVGPAEHDGLVVRVELPAHDVGSPLNELRVGDTRRTVARSAADLSTSASAALNLPGIPVRCAVSQYVADVPDFGLPAARFTPEHGDGLQHQRHPDCRFAVVAEGTPYHQARCGSPLGAPERRAAAVAYRVVHLQQPVHRSPRRLQHRHAVGQFPARTGAAVLDRSAAGRDPQPRTFPGVLRPGRLAAIELADGQRRSSIYAELPLDRDQRSGGCLQSRNQAARLPRTRRQPANGARTAQGQFRPATRHCRARHRQDGRPYRLCACLDRAGRHHDAFHHAGLSIPADRVATHAR